MKRYRTKLRAVFPRREEMDFTIPAGMVVELGGDPDYILSLGIFEELPESQEKDNAYCSEHKVFNCRHPQTVEKEWHGNGDCALCSCTDGKHFRRDEEKDDGFLKNCRCCDKEANSPDKLCKNCKKCQPQEKEKCDCKNSKNQVCDICQGVTGDEKDVEEECKHEGIPESVLRGYTVTCGKCNEVIEGMAQPKRKPSEILMEREFLLRYEKLKSKPWYISKKSVRNATRWEALLDFLDEYLK